MRAIEPVEEEQARLEAERTTELVSELMDDVQTLVRDEVQLVKLELRRQADQVQRGGKLIGTGGAMAMIAGSVLAFALVFLLAEVMPLWAAAGIVAILLAVAAAVVVAAGVNALKNVAPERAVEPLKEEGRWIKETLRDVRSHRREPTLH